MAKFTHARQKSSTQRRALAMLIGKASFVAATAAFLFILIDSSHHAVQLDAQIAATPSPSAPGSSTKPIIITNVEPKPSFWDTLGAPISALAAGGATVLGASITINGAYRQQRLVESRRDSRIEQNRIISSIKETQTKMVAAWDLWRRLDDGRLAEQYSAADEVAQMSAIRTALSEVGLARIDLQSQELEELVDKFVEDLNQAMRNPLPSGEDHLRNAVNRDMQTFEDEAKIIVREIKYAGVNSHGLDIQRPALGDGSEQDALPPGQRDMNSPVKQLSSDNLDVRIGAIYALERVAVDSRSDYPIVMNVLIAFIRRSSGEHLQTEGDTSSPTRSIRPDVQAALTVIGRRESWHDEQGIDLARLDLTGAELTGARLAQADLAEVNLTRANLTRAQLTRAQLKGAKLTGANLTSAHINEARLTNADLSGADLTEAELAWAKLADADLTGANLTMVSLTGADPMPFRRACSGWSVVDAGA